MISNCANEAIRSKGKACRRGVSPNDQQVASVQREVSHLHGVDEAVSAVAQAGGDVVRRRVAHKTRQIRDGPLVERDGVHGFRVGV